jgi:hypothetical protein
MLPEGVTLLEVTGSRLVSPLKEASGAQALSAKSVERIIHNNVKRLIQSPS